MPHAARFFTQHPAHQIPRQIPRQIPGYMLLPTCYRKAISSALTPRHLDYTYTNRTQYWQTRHFRHTAHHSSTACIMGSKFWPKRGSPGILHHYVRILGTPVLRLHALT
jgi:hypothetical protein